MIHELYGSGQLTVLCSVVFNLYLQKSLQENSIKGDGLIFGTDLSQIICDILTADIVYR